MMILELHRQGLSISARLGKANMVRFARRPAANEAGLRRHIFAVPFVTQANRLDGSASRGCQWLAV
jgi:hypothetical protein